MPRASTCFSNEQRAQIATTIAESESKTTAEIVPVVASASGRYDRAEDTVGLFAGFALFGLTWYWYPRSHDDLGSWAANPGSYELVAFALALFVGFVAGTSLASRWNGLRGLFTPKKQMLDEVNGRAREAFYDSRIRQTKCATGMLIFVSLFERTAVVLADTTVTEKLGQAALDALCARLVADIRQGDVATAIGNAIRSAGEKLASALPAADGDANELPNTLVLLD